MNIDVQEIVVYLEVVYYDNNPLDNIISYGILKGRGVFLERCTIEVGVHQADQMKVFDVFHHNNVVQVDIIGGKLSSARV